MRNDTFQTKGERREAKRDKENRHPVHGRSLEAIMNAERKRAAEIERRDAR